MKEFLRENGTLIAWGLFVVLMSVGFGISDYMRDAPKRQCISMHANWKNNTCEFSR